MGTQRYPLTEDQLMEKAPSIYAPHAHAERSGKYSFVSTPQILDTLRGEGWVPTEAVQCRVRVKGGEVLSRQGYQKHMIRLAREADIIDQYKKESILELVLRNSSDGTCKIQLDAGFFRMVCANGMVVQSASFGGIKFKHMGLDMNEVITATQEIVTHAPTLADTMERWKRIELSDPARLAFASDALEARYGEETPPVEPRMILIPRRYEDNKNDLWHTYNVIQEQLIKGGAKEWRRIAGGRRRSIRAVKAIDGNVDLNKKLWSLAQSVETVNS